MIGQFNAVLDWIFAALTSKGMVTFIDIVALCCAFIPVIYFVVKILFADAATAQEALRSTRTLKRFSFLCVLEVLLHALTIPAIMKVTTGIVVIVLAVLIVLFDH